MGVIKKAIKPMFKNDKWHIVRGDTVKLLCGKDKGQVGTVLRVFRDDRIPRVLVGGLNLVKKHVKQEKGSNAPGIITKEAPIHYSNVALIDPVTKGAVRVQWRFLEDGTKVRVGKGKLASGSIIPRPESLRTVNKPTLPGNKDTSRSAASEITYSPDELPDLWIGRSNVRTYSTTATPSPILQKFLGQTSFSSGFSWRRERPFRMHSFSASAYCL